MVKRFLLAVIVIFACSLLPAARKALVIGNAQYQDKPLKNTVNDAKDIKSKLESLGFKVSIFLDTDQEQLYRAIYDFTEALDSSDEAIFYYAGHGAQVQGQNYLLPVKPLMRDEISVVNNSYKCDELLARMKKPQVCIIFLDACRNNPYSGNRSLSRGLASMTGALPSQLIVFSTMAGQEAMDGDDRNSPFALALMKYISQPLRFDTILRNVTEEVELLTGGKQVPTRTGDLRTDYYFVPEPLEAIPPVEAPPLSIPDLSKQLSVMPEPQKPAPKQQSQEPEIIIVNPSQSKTTIPEIQKAGTKEPETVIIKPPQTTTVQLEPAPQEPPKIELPAPKPVVPEATKPSPSPVVTPKPNPVQPESSKTATPTKEEPKPVTPKLDFSKVEQLKNDKPKSDTSLPEIKKTEPAFPPATLPKPQIIELKTPELAAITPNQPLQPSSPPEAVKLEYGSAEVTANVDGEIYLDNSTTAYKSVNKNSSVRIDQLHAGNCRITFKSARYTDSKDVYIYKGQTQQVDFSFPEPVVPTGFIYLTGGSFEMGSGDGAADEKPLHSVTLSPFSMSACEVTVAQFRRFVAATNYKTSAELKGRSTIVDKKTGNFKSEKDINWQNPGYDVRDSDPVSCISWYDAIAYCNWLSDREKLPPAYSINENPYPKDWSKGIITCNPKSGGYRLPTEAEWEYAARGGVSGQRFSGSNNLDEVAVYAAKNNWQPAFAASHDPNDFGLYDLSGNLAEWCWDWYDDSYYSRSEATDPLGPLYATRKGTPTRVVRGGAWYSSADRCSVSARDNCEPERQETGIGFRVVKSVREI